MSEWNALGAYIALVYLAVNKPFSLPDSGKLIQVWVLMNLVMNSLRILLALQTLTRCNAQKFPNSYS